jgi:hypothetical protein
MATRQRLLGAAFFFVVSQTLYKGGWLCYFTIVAKCKAKSGAYQWVEKTAVIFAGLALFR